MLIKTSQWLQERASDAPTKGLLWLHVAGYGRRSGAEREGNTSTGLKYLFLKNGSSQGQNLALTVLLVPDSGGGGAGHGRRSWCKLGTHKTVTARLWPWRAGRQMSLPRSRKKSLPLRSTAEWGAELLLRNTKRFRGGLALKAHRLMHHSSLVLRVLKIKKEGGAHVGGHGPHPLTPDPSNLNQKSVLEDLMIFKSFLLRSTAKGGYTDVAGHG